MMISPFTDEQQKELQDAMLAADGGVLNEIIREAEIFIGEQFKAALAADSRALTLAGVLGAGITLLTGNLVSVSGTNAHIWPYAAGIVIIIVGFIVALFNAIAAAKPTTFEYNGNSPDEWLQDIKNSTPLTEALAGQAFAYAVGIRRNKVTLEMNQARINRAMSVALASIVAGCAIAAFIAIVRFADGRFP